MGTPQHSHPASSERGLERIAIDEDAIRFRSCHLARLPTTGKNPAVTPTPYAGHSQNRDLRPPELTAQPLYLSLLLPLLGLSLPRLPALSPRLLRLSALPARWSARPAD